MAYILDILVVVIFALSIFLAYKKGLIKTLFSLVGGIAAVALAVSLSGPVSTWLNDQFIEPAIRDTVLTAVNGSSLGQSYDEAIDSVDVAGKLQEMPENLRVFLEKLNVNVDEIVTSAEETRENSIAAKEALIDSIVTPVSETISKAIALIGLALIFFILLFVVTRLLDTVFRVLPFGKSLNKAGGILFGAIRALLVVMLFGAVVYGLAGGNVLVSMEDLEKTLILKIINQFNPIVNVIK